MDITSIIILIFGVIFVLAGLVGVIVDAATGAWYSLDEKNVNAVLETQRP